MTKTGPGFDPAFPIYNPSLEGDAFYWSGGPVGILLCHGFTATTAEVRPLGKILHQKGYTVSGPLLPGHYTTPEDLNKVTWQEWAETVEASYQELKMQCKAIFAGGESIGALLALRLAALHPEICGVLAYAPALKLNLTWFDRLRLYLTAPWMAYVPKTSMDSDTLWQGYLVNPIHGVIQLLKLQREISYRLPEINQPVLVVQGRLDPTVHPTVPGIIVESVSSRRKEVHWMDNSRHVVILDKELDRVSEITLDFIHSICSL